MATRLSPMGAYYDPEKKITICREYGETPIGNNFNGRWVMRINGVLHDFDTYQSDLLERNNLKAP